DPRLTDVRRVGRARPAWKLDGRVSDRGRGRGDGGPGDHVDPLESLLELAPEERTDPVRLHQVAGGKELLVLEQGAHERVGACDLLGMDRRERLEGEAQDDGGA